jgi:hypothetical protein
MRTCTHPARPNLQLQQCLLLCAAASCSWAIYTSVRSVHKEHRYRLYCVHQGGCCCQLLQPQSFCGGRKVHDSIATEQYHVLLQWHGAVLDGLWLHPVRHMIVIQVIIIQVIIIKAVVCCDACRVYVPGPYFTADQLGELKLQATINIQRFTRGWFARKRARRLHALKGEREDFLMTQVGRWAWTGAFCGTGTSCTW